MRVWVIKNRVSFTWLTACLCAFVGLTSPAHAFNVEDSDPQLIRQLMFVTLAAIVFFSAIIVWVFSALQRVRRKQRTRTAFVNSALNNMRQGLIMVSAEGRLVFCNDYYLRMYGLTRADIQPRMEVQKILEIRKSRGTYLGDPTKLVARTDNADRMVRDFPDGRSILATRHWLPNGGWVTTHEDISEQRTMSKQLATTKRFLESVIDNIPVCVAVKDLQNGKYILANAAFEQFSRFSRDQIVGRRPEEIFSPSSAEAVLEADEAAILSPSGQANMEVWVERGARKRLLEARRVVAHDENGKPEFLVALFEDITEQREMATQIEDSKKFLELVVDNIPVALIVKDVKDGKYLLANRSAETVLKHRREDVVGRTLEEVYGVGASKFSAARDAAAIRKRGLVTEEHPINTENGLRLFLTRRVTVVDDHGEPRYLIKTNEDITERRQTESRMAHMAYHDGLTDLPNRVAFVQALTQMIEACAGLDEFAVLSIDLDGFKEVNDVFGHIIGDRLLIEVARRVQSVAQGAVIARLGGDEFGLIVDGVQPATGEALAARVAEMMSREFAIDGETVRVGVTIGIAVFPSNGHDAASLLANADAALFRAKAEARGSVRVFAAEMDQQIRDRRAMHQELAGALNNDELVLHYQPQAHVGADVIGFEALVRWRHPTRGMVPPGTFIPLAEESGLIVAMGEWILRESCREAASWKKPLQIAVNLSPVQFLHGDLVALVHSILLETGLAPGRLELEITEGVLISDFDRGLALLRRLKGLGVRIAMDDFGSGYSSLSYLQSFPFDKIKIDRVFVMNLGINAQSAPIVRAVIGLGRGLDVPIVAEGVETAAQLEFLAEEKCDQVQGYFIGRPAPISQYAAIVDGLTDRVVPTADVARKAG